MPRARSRPGGDAGDRLSDYRAKRSAGATPEPFGAGEERPGLFVVQRHAARRLHYDFRLEIGGVLRSWAVPRGPALDPAVKRLAVATEDHPLEYAEFEGVIPEGNYGAGAVIVWDRGLAVHHLDPAAGVDAGKLLFELRGYKLRGLWTLVKTARDEKEWLLIKKPDAAATGQAAADLGDESVLSGLTVEELRDGTLRAAEIRADLEAAGARRRRLRAGDVRPMLAKLRGEPFSDPEWIYELKYDGYRVLAGIDDGAAGHRSRGRLFYRSGREATAAFPEITRALSALPWGSLVLDGEVVVLDDDAHPLFEALHQRARLGRRREIAAAAVRCPATLYVFDCLEFEGLDLRQLPLLARKAFLRRMLPRAGPLRYTEHIVERGEALYEEVRSRGLEGILAKRADSPYRAGRSPHWLKIRAEKVGDFAVVGYTRPQGSRKGFGALHLGALSGARMLYAGRVGSGFDERQLRDIRRRLEGHRRPEPAVGGAPPEGPEHVWVEPRLVVEVRFTEQTASGQLRHPVFHRLRDDKRPEECLLEAAPPPAGEAEERAQERPSPPRRIEVTRPEKVFWPDAGLTKGDLVGYYRAIAPWLLPYLRDRPLVLTRYPDGVAGKSFFQKNAPEFTPDWLRTESIWSEDSGKETRTYVCDDEPSLAYLANLGAIPLHLWASRLASLQHPDWCILDLDAKDAPFRAAVAVAREIHRLCEEIGLPSHAKTSGATGLHVLLPLGGQCTFEQARQLAELLARAVAARLPEIASLARQPRARRGKVYIDTLQNGYGKLLVAPFSVRPLPGAPVSMPLGWHEVNRGLDPRRFTIGSAVARLRRMKRDPLAPVLSGRPDLPGALSRLAELF